MNKPEENIKPTSGVQRDEQASTSVEVSKAGSEIRTHVGDILKQGPAQAPMLPEDFFNDPGLDVSANIPDFPLFWPFVKDDFFADYIPEHDLPVDDLGED